MMDDDERKNEQKPKIKYRLEALTTDTSYNLNKRRRNHNISQLTLQGISNGEFLTVYLHWLFRVNFLFLLCCFCVVWFGWVLFYAVLILIAGDVDRQCVRIGGAEFGAAGTELADAFQLSWTTISTVGYGSSSPAIGYQNDNPNKCFFVSLLCAIESLHGILFSGFCGAILFGKILRIQSRAQVRFSDAVLIRYGKGLKSHYDQKANPNVGQEPCGDSDDDDDDDDEEQCANNEASGFPVLEFRVMNLLFDKLGGEIVDAHINVVANINAIDDLDHSVHGINPADFKAATFGDDSNGNDRTDTATSTTSTSNASTSPPGVPLMRRFESSRRNLSSGSANSRRTLSGGSSESSASRRNLFAAYPGSVGRRNLMSSSDGGDINSTHHRAFFAAIEEHEMIVATKTTESGGVHTAECELHKDVFEKQKKRLFSVGKQVFMKVHLKAQDHPLFKRVWLLSHMLDPNSPLLKPKVKHEIMANNGRWPSKYNAVTDIRDCIQFNQLLVSLNGVANYSASDAYAQKIYDFADVCIGYEFVDMLYRSPADQSLSVDGRLINDVREQLGGGGQLLDVEYS